MNGERIYDGNDIWNKLEKKYRETSDTGIRACMKGIIDTGSINVFNSAFTEKACYKNVECEYDSENGLLFTYYTGKKMYMSRAYRTPEQVRAYVSVIMQEQDVKSPHCYFSEYFYVNDGDVVIDAGVAEGNFALSIVDHVSKLYLVETDPAWTEALRYTFEPYKDRVEIIPKYLSDKNDDKNITIDSIAGGQTINVIKMDIEGAEISALIGAEETIRRNPAIRIAACSYHKHNDEIIIRAMMEHYGLKTATSEGYMLFIWEKDFFDDPEFRRGLVYSVPETTERKDAGEYGNELDWPEETKVFLYIPDFRDDSCTYISDLERLCTNIRRDDNELLVIYLNEKRNNNEVLLWYIINELNKYSDCDVDVRIIDGNKVPLDVILKRSGKLVRLQGARNII